MVDFAGLFEHVENRQYRPGAEVDVCGQTVRNHTRNVFDEAAAGDVGDTLDHAGLEQRGEGLHINLRRGEEHVAELFAVELVKHGIDGIASLLEQGFAHQREAVGMYAGGRQTNEHIALSDGGAVHDCGLLGNTDRETGQIVLVFVIHARHFSGFATDQTGTSLYAAVGNASHNLLEQCWIVLAAGDVIQEEQRFRTLSGNIVDAHGHAVDADGVVLVGHLGNDQLGADAVSAGNQYRLLVSEGSQIEQAAEAADTADHARTVGARHMGLDALDDFVTGFDAYAGFLICFWHIKPFSGSVFFLG